ncbi:MAG: ASCH domain-containing protein, partial [Gemmatimonadaceae bacterium]
MVGGKDIENRSKRTRFRGTILLHASATRPAADAARAFQADARAAGWIESDDEWEFGLGAILGMID